MIPGFPIHETQNMLLDSHIHLLHSSLVIHVKQESKQSMKDQKNNFQIKMNQKRRQMTLKLEGLSPHPII
jgi:Tfp pilus assembly protein PilN